MKITQIANNQFPKWLSQYAIIVYFVALATISVIYSAYKMPWYFMLSGIIAVLSFFIYSKKLSNKLSLYKIYQEKYFEKRIFRISFVIRFLYMFTMYVIFQTFYGDSFGFDNVDVGYYNELGEFVASLIKDGNFHFYKEISHYAGHDDISDMGYGVYMGIIYWLTHNNIFVVRLLKCIWSSLTVLLLYRLAERNFGEQTGRVAAILCAMWPNFWYYCGTHLKETEMVFLAVLYVEQADQMLRSRQFTAWKVIPVLLIAAVMFTFRTPLALVALLALVFSVVMSSARVVSWGKRIIVGVLAVLLVGVTAGNRIEEQSRALVEQVQGGTQKHNMEWRSTREHGNKFAKYAGAAVFAPMIFTIPFPTMVRPWEGQEVQQMNNGGNFIKNIMSFFTLLALVMLLMTGRWREHILPLSFMAGYLMVLTVSVFAQSERFHQPVMPLELMFAAYGLSIAVTRPKYKRWFTYWSVLTFLIVVGWNWFKLAGRGLA